MDFPELKEKDLSRYRNEVWGQPLYNCSNCADLKVVKQQIGPESFEIIHCHVCTGGTRQLWLNKYSGLSQGELQRSMDDYKMLTPQHKNAKMMIDKALNTRAGLYSFWGDFGSGKSAALTTVTAEIIRVGVEAYYSPMAKILDHIRSMYATHQDSTAFWDRLLTIPCLALDEVSRFNDTPWAKEKLFILADQRYRLRGTHITLFATNENPTEDWSTAEAIGYLFSRMNDGDIVRLEGDLRG
jgi:DNA replication protein DnaC